MNKVAIIVYSDPKTGSEEALGRLFNALATAYELKQNKKEVSILFQGTGTRWAGELIKKDHPANELFKAVKDKVAGVSCGCANVFGAVEGAEACGLDLIKDNPIPNTPGIASLARLIDEGYTILNF